MRSRATAALRAGSAPRASPVPPRLPAEPASASAGRAPAADAVPAELVACVSRVIPVLSAATPVRRPWAESVVNPMYSPRPSG